MSLSRIDINDLLVNTTRHVIKRTDYQTLKQWAVDMAPIPEVLTEVNKALSDYLDATKDESSQDLFRSCNNNQLKIDIEEAQQDTQEAIDDEETSKQLDAEFSNNIEQISALELESTDVNTENQITSLQQRNNEIDEHKLVLQSRKTGREERAKERGNRIEARDRDDQAGNQLSRDNRTTYYRRLSGIKAELDDRHAELQRAAIEGCYSVFLHELSPMNLTGLNIAQQDTLVQVQRSMLEHQAAKAQEEKDRVNLAASNVELAGLRLKLQLEKNRSTSATSGGNKNYSQRIEQIDKEILGIQSTRKKLDIAFISVLAAASIALIAAVIVMTFVAMASVFVPVLYIPVILLGMALVGIMIAEWVQHVQQNQAKERKAGIEAEPDAIDKNAAELSPHENTDIQSLMTAQIDLEVRNNRLIASSLEFHEGEAVRKLQKANNLDVQLVSAFHAPFHNPASSSFMESPSKLVFGAEYDLKEGEHPQNHTASY